MQVTQTNADGLKREFKVVISAQDLNQKLDSRLREIGQSVRIPGFRPGKVPAALLKKRFAASVMGEIVEASVSDSASQAMMEQGVRPALQPKIEITSYEEGSDLEYTMAVELMPEFEPNELAKIELERLTVKVDDKEIEDALGRIAEQQKRSEPIKEPRKSQAGDVLVIDFNGSIDGKEFPGGTADDHHLELGSNAFIAGFEDQLTGVGVGDHIAVKVTFPAEYANDKFAGKDALFEVDVKEIREPVPVPIDDALAKLTGHDDLTALKVVVGESISREYETLARARLKRGLLDKLSESHDFEVPEGMVELEFESIWSQVEEQRKQGEGEPEDEGKDEDEIKADYRAIAVRRVRLGLLLSEIGRRANVDVAQEDVTKAIMAEAQQLPGREQEVFEFYQKNDQAMANLRAPLFEEKVIDHILSQATVSEREVSVEELMAEPEAEAGEGRKAKTKSKAEAGSKAKADAQPKAKAKSESKSEAKSKPKSKSKAKSKPKSKSKAKPKDEAKPEADETAEK